MSRNEVVIGELAMGCTGRTPGFIHPSQPKARKQRPGSSAASSQASLNRLQASLAPSTTRGSMRRSTSEASLADRRAWREGKGATSLANSGFEITQWTVPSRPLKSTTQTDYVGATGVPARPTLPAKVNPKDTERTDPALSTHLADFVKWPAAPTDAEAPPQLGSRVCEMVQPKAHILGPAEDRDYGGPFWGKTTTAESYKPPPLPPPMVPWQSKQPVVLARKADYHSTYALSYLPHNSEPAPSMRPPGISFRSTPGKTGVSTYQHDYYDRPLNPKEEPWQNAERRKIPVGSSGPPQHSTYNLDFIDHGPRKQLLLDLGVQISSRPYKHGGQGGQFFLMIPAGSAAPADRSQAFTTVVDGQQLAQIVIVARKPGDEQRQGYEGSELGFFDMRGIKAAAVGVPRVSVTFRLIKENLLKVTATYEQGHRTRQLVVQDRRSIRDMSLL